MSAAIDPADAAFIASMGSNRSAALRLVVAAGINALKGQSPDPGPMAEMRRLSERLEEITRPYWHVSTHAASTDHASLRVAR